MRIIQLMPGSGDNFYCENCLRDLTLVRAMARAGHEMTLVPMYLPVEMDAAAVTMSPLFLGGVNVYLQQKFSLFRKTPRWLDRWFDHPALLRRIGKLSGMTTAHELGQTTLSMLQGVDGRQQKEIARLTDWLVGLIPKPDVVIFSNILLTGLAPMLKEKLCVPMVCLLQDEDGFIEALGQPWNQRVWNQISEHLSFFDLFLPVSRYYLKVMQEHLPIPPQKIEVLAPGIDVVNYKPAAASPQVPTIGFLGRMCPANGFDIMTAAFNNLALGDDEFFDNARLLICGGKTSADKTFVNRHLGCLHCPGLSERFEVKEDFSLPTRLEFLERLSVLCSPCRQPPAYAMNVLEAMACGIPFVAPRAGVYSEWAEMTGAGVLYEPNTPFELERTLHALLKDTAKVRELGVNGRQAILTHFDIAKCVGILIKRLQEC